MKSLATALVILIIAALGLVPMLFAAGPGSEIQKPIAAVVIGGLVSSTFLTPFVLPVLYRWFEESRKAGSPVKPLLCRHRKARRTRTASR